MRWLLLLAAVIFAELVTVWQVGLLVGFWPTVGLIAATGVLGAALAKREGLRVWGEWREALEQGKVPAVGLVDGLLVFLGGLLLLAPGLLGDVVGVFLLVPPTRRLVANFVRARLEARFGQVAAAAAAEGGEGASSPFSGFTVIQTGSPIGFSGEGFSPSGFGGDAFGDRFGGDRGRDDRDIVVIETTGEAVDEDVKPKLLLPPGG